MSALIWYQYGHRRAYDFLRAISEHLLSSLVKGDDIARHILCHQGRSTIVNDGMKKLRFSSDGGVHSALVLVLVLKWLHLPSLATADAEFITYAQRSRGRCALGSVAASLPVTWRVVVVVHLIA